VTLRDTLVRAPRLLPLLLLLLVGCGYPVPVSVPEVVRLLPHDTGAYTQGLLLHEGLFYESTGQYGSSTLREVDVETGEVLRMVELGEDYFGEGIALVDDRIIQLTWREGVAFVYDLETFDVVDTFEYQGEGWGLCFDGRYLFMTTGGSFLQRRDPATFSLLESVQITLGGNPLFQVNELACVGDHVYGNVYMTDRIVQMEKATGVVVAEVDGSMLEPAGGRPLQSDAVMNGIAHDPDSDLFYLTGKLWSSIFEVRLDLR
jgi:glutaminyl-peptide cyclotransferase